MTPQPPPNRQSVFTLERFSKILFTLALLILLYLLVVYFVYANNLFNFPFDYDQGEGFELVDSIMFSQLQWPYQNTEIYPFYSSNYPPLFHVMMAPFVWLFGPAYWYGRLLSFLGTLVTASAIGWVVNKEGQNRTIAILAGLAFLASNFVYHIGPLIRQHMTMVMFETLGVIILAYAYPKKQNRWIALGLGLIIAAGYTKQLAAISAIAIFIWFFIRNPQRAILWGLGFAATGIGLFLWINIATDGEWWRQAIVANVNKLDPFQTFGLFRLWFKLHGFLIVPAALLVIYELYFDRLSIYSLWFVFASVLGGIGSGAWGAGDSYFTTAIAAMSILSGIFAARTLQRSWQFPSGHFNRSFAISQLSRYSLIIMPVLYIGYGVSVFHTPTNGPVFSTIASTLSIQPNVRESFYDSATYDAVGYANIGYLTTQEDIDAGFRIVDMMKSAEQPVLSEEAGFSINANEDVITNPTQLLNLWKAGEYEGDELLKLIESQGFAFIILRAQFYPVPILEAIGQHYQIAETISMNGFDYLILRPFE